MSVLWFFLCVFFKDSASNERKNRDTELHQNEDFFFVSKHIVKKVKRQHIEWEKRCENYLCNKGLSSKIYKGLLHQ